MRATTITRTMTIKKREQETAMLMFEMSHVIDLHVHLYISDYGTPRHP